jgi:hypothetical protein
LSTEEYYDCKLRLETGKERQKVVKSLIRFSDVLAALGQDLDYLISDPEVIRRKKLAREQSQSSLSSRSDSPSAPAHVPGFYAEGFNTSECDNDSEQDGEVRRDAVQV